MALSSEEYDRALRTGVIPRNASAEDRANIGLTREALARQGRGEEQRNMANYIERNILGEIE